MSDSSKRRRRTTRDEASSAEPMRSSPASSNRSDGLVATETRRIDRSRDPRPLDARVETTERGVIVRLSIRAEKPHVERRTVVREQVVVRREQRTERTQRRVPVTREELRVETTGDSDLTQRIDVRGNDSDVGTRDR